MNEEVREVLDNNILGAVATLNDDGSPWVSPVHVVSDDDAVYWFSHETTQRSTNIARDARVSLTLFSPDLSGGPKGIYIQGRAEKLDAAQTATAKGLLEAKIGFIPQNFVEMTGYRLPIGSLNRDKSKGKCWYFYS